MENEGKERGKVRTGRVKKEKSKKRRHKNAYNKRKAVKPCQADVKKYAQTTHKKATLSHMPNHKELPFPTSARTTQPFPRKL